MSRSFCYDDALALADQEDADLDRVAELLERAHAEGDSRATYALATWYLHGKYFRKNLRQGISLLRNAAKDGIPEALYDLAASYEQGIGVPKNQPLAAELYLKSFLAGDGDALHEIGRCFYHGIGVEKNRRIAWALLDHAKEAEKEGLGAE